jgi:hypothetical protein
LIRASSASRTAAVQAPLSADGRWAAQGLMLEAGMNVAHRLPRPKLNFAFE